MAKRTRLTRFRGRYDSFLSEASNEEIVSISKELTDEMTTQVKIVNSSGLALTCISMITLLFTILVISSSTASTSGSVKTTIFLFRIMAIALICASAFVASMAVTKAMNASSISTVFWRNVRETADDEKVYEQMLAVRRLNIIISTAKSNVKSSVFFLVIGGAFLGIAFLYELLVTSGYL